MFEAYTPLTKDISIILKEIECKLLVMPLMLRKDGDPMRTDLNVYFCYHRARGHHMDDYNILNKEAS